MKNATATNLITSVSEKLAHRPSPKRTRTEIWTACGKRIRTDRLMQVTPELNRELCPCAKS